MGPGTSFQPIIDLTENRGKISKIILCSGKHYYTLLEALSRHPTRTLTSLIRIEELSPFPSIELRDTLKHYTKLDKVLWAQEEPENQGAWTFVRPRIEDILSELGIITRLKYAGRRSMPTVTVGVGNWHKREVEEIISAALVV